MMESTNKQDIYETVTQSIIKMIESGHYDSWRKNWKGGFARNLISKEAYKGINTLLLASSMIENEFTQPYFLTIKQANELGGQIKKGAHATMIVYWNIYEKESDVIDEQGEPVKETACFLRRYFVFNVAQIEGIDQYIEKVSTQFAIDNQNTVIQTAQNWIAATGAKIIHGGHRACYSPNHDKVQLPEFKQFDTANDYYSTAFHELAHWTGHVSRLNRDFSGRFGSESYAFEELIAELTSSYVDTELGFAGFQMPNHINYIASWLKILRNDKKAIFTASKQALMAYQFLSDLRKNNVVNESKELQVA